MIITECNRDSKEVENNSIAKFNAYARQYVPVGGGEPATRVGNGDDGGSH